MEDMNAKVERAKKFSIELKALVAGMRQAEAKVAGALLEMKRRGWHKCLAYATVPDFALQELKIAKGKAKELIELARKLEKLPRIRAAFEAGEICWTKARLIARVAKEGDERQWLEVAETHSSRALERRIAAAKGDKVRVRVVLDMTEEEAADFHRAIRHVRETSREPLTVGAAAAGLARQAMGSPVDRPGYQPVIHECPTCETASRDAAAGPIPTGRGAVAAAKLAAEVIDFQSLTPVFRSAIKPSERRNTIPRNDHGGCALGGSDPWSHLHDLPRHDADIIPPKAGDHGRSVMDTGSAPHLRFARAYGTAIPQGDLVGASALSRPHRRSCPVPAPVPRAASTGRRARCDTAARSTAGCAPPRSGSRTSTGRSRSHSARRRPDR